MNGVQRKLSGKSVQQVIVCDSDRKTDLQKGAFMMQKQRLSLSFSDYAAGIGQLNIEDQLRLTEIIFANFRKMLNSRKSGLLQEESGDDLSRFCGKWQDDREAEEIVAQIYADRAKNMRSEKIGL